MKALRAAAPYVAVALAAATVLFFSLRLGERNLGVPFDFLGDGLFYAVMTKAVAEDGFLHFYRLGAPFGMDLFDWPTGMLLDFSVLAAGTRALGEPGRALNLYWLSSVTLTALGAAWAFRRLAVAPAAAFPLGLLFGLLPYAFYRSVGHISLAYHFVPFLALLLVRVAEGHPEAAGRGERWATRAACVLQGLGYPYYGFFAAALLVPAGLLGWLRTRSASAPRAAALAIALVAGATAAGMAPSSLYWSRHGANPELQYKVPAESEMLGLKIRHVVTPIADHPLPAFRRVVERFADARFPIETENLMAKVGLVASAGFLLLLGLSVAGAAARLREVPPLLHVAAALNLSAVLLATVGGFSSVFAVFVTASIRGWSRIVVFIAFFSLLAVGVTLTAVLRRVAAGRGTHRRVAAAATVALLGLAVFDQVSPTHLVYRMEEDARLYAQDRAFVRRAESLLAPGTLVFQLPHTPTPLDASLGPMLAYDHARAYLHSRTLLWSWGAISGRHGNWQAEVSGLPPAEMLRRLALAGFGAVWIDRFGWAEGRLSPYARTKGSPEAAIVAAAGLPADASPEGRYAVVALHEVRRRLEASLGPERLAREAVEALRTPVVPRWTAGFTDPEGDGARVRRLGAPAARIAFKNALDRVRRVELTATLRPVGTAGGTLHVTGLLEETLALSGDLEWRRVVVLPARSRGRMDLRFEPSFECPVIADDARCYELVNFTASDIESTALTLPGEDGAEDAVRDAP